MDLRARLQSEADIRKASELLSYQPFRLTDDIFTGVAHSWIYHEGGGNRQYRPSDWVFRRNERSQQEFDEALDANLRLAKMYDDWLDAIAERFPGASVAEVGCNTGYFLLGSQLRGMGECTGADEGFHYSRAISFLNGMLDTQVNYIPIGYSSWSHQVPGLQPHDIIIASAVVQHISDTLYFLDYLGKLAKKALFLFIGTGPGDDYKIYYNTPNILYSRELRPFPICFDCYVAPSKGLLYKSLEMMGFNRVTVLPWQPDWLPVEWKGEQEALICSRD